MDVEVYPIKTERARRNENSKPLAMFATCIELSEEAVERRSLPGSDRVGSQFSDHYQTLVREFCNMPLGDRAATIRKGSSSTLMGGC